MKAGIKMILLLIGSFILIPGSTWAQKRYIVHFKDKQGSPYSIQSPQAYLSERAIDRRQRLHISITTEDLPVNPSYTQQVRAAGAQVYYTSRWQNCALIQTTPDILSSIASLPFVSEIELAAPGVQLPNNRTKSFRSVKESGIAEATRTQLEMIGLDEMHAENVRGEGVLVALFDSGYQGVDTAAPFSHLIADQKISYTFDFVRKTDAVFQYDDHGTAVLSIIAANSANFTGGAYEATFQLYVTEDVPTEYRVEEYNWLFAAERADSSGVDVISSSLGYNLFDDQSMNYSAQDLDGKTAVVSKAAAAAIQRGILVVVSAGNEGSNSWGLVTPPADVDGILAVGSVNSQGARSISSSRGPTADNRIKPDVMAMGSSTAVIQPSGGMGTVSGTSVAAPIITSLVIGLRQKFPEMSVQEICSAIKSTSSRASQPDNLFGYGIPFYHKVLDALADPISIYPNPADGSSVKIKLRSVNQPTEILIYNIEGKKVIEQTLLIGAENNPAEIDLTGLSAGTYLVKVKTNDNFKTIRLIKR